MLTKEKIMLYLQCKYETLTSQYGSNNILGLFTIGIANYGFAETEDEIQITCIYLPTFEELCTVSPIDKIENNVHILDIRAFYNAAHMYSFNYVEILFSQYNIINPKYNYLFETLFLNKKEYFAKYCEKNRIKQAMDRAMQALKEYNLFEVYRLLYGSKAYLATTCEDAFHPKNQEIIDKLWEYKHSVVDPLTIDYTGITMDFTELLCAASDEKHPGVDKQVKEGVIALMTLALQNNVDLGTFEASLTETEKKAYNELRKRLVNNETNISISQITIETGYSRPVYKNLLAKLKESNIAEVINQGTKGTYIRFLI